MLTLYAAVDGPALVIADRTFHETILIIGSPIYGRVLFTNHGIVIRNCYFTR